MIGIRPPNSGQPFGQHHTGYSLFTNDRAHFANGLHGTNQILDSHNITSEIEIVVYLKIKFTEIKIAEAALAALSVIAL